MCNDHPQGGAIDPSSMSKRWDGLTGLLDLGIDFWWYDRNWTGIMSGPVPGIDRDVWGQRVFTDIHARFRPGERPMLMSMRSGAENKVAAPIERPHPAS